LEGLDRQEIRRWYNGYHWRGEHKLYNPWDILSLLDEREFNSHWFDTATPAYLYRLIADSRFPVMELEGAAISRRQLTQFDIDQMDLQALMFQSGYLTIAEERHIEEDIHYMLEYPNFEVRRHFNAGFLSYSGREDAAAQGDGRALLDCLASNDFNGFADQLKAAYAAMPHQWYRKSKLSRYEAHYLSVLYAHFNAVGAEARVEEASSRGQSDLALRHVGQVFVMEAKVVEGTSEAQAESALAAAMVQLRERGYGEKYGGRGQPVHLLALVFSSETRSLLALKAEPA